LPNGTDPEARVIICGLSWQRYLDLDKALDDDRPGPRFYYLDGDLEIWFWRQSSLEIFALRQDMSGYERVSRSHLLPQLDIALLKRGWPSRETANPTTSFWLGLGRSLNRDLCRSLEHP
jgi:hypothetical protein